MAGDLPIGWELATLEDRMDAIIDYRGKTPRKTTFGIPLITAKVVKGGRIETPDEFIDPAEYDEWMRRGLPKKGDILITTEAPLGEVAQLGDEKVALAQRLIALRGKPNELDNTFLKFLLQSDFIQFQLGARASGSTVSGIKQSELRKVQLRLPPFDEQQAIAGILGALDDKIELNRRMNRTLEGMARAIFQSWFVDFNPVRAKAAGRTPPGLSAEVAKLFPDRFENSAIGKVPKDWKVERFADHVTADRGLSYKGEGLREDASGVPMHNLNSILEGGGYKHVGIKHYAGEYREKHLLVPGDLIVTNTEQGFDHLLIGYAAIVPAHFGPTGIYSHHIYRVRPKITSPFNPHYLVELINSRRWHDWISGFSNGTTINMLPLDAMEKPLLVVPPAKLIERYSELAKAAHDLVEDNRRESATLAALRDALLPKLISGELRVPDAERIVGRCE